MVDDREKQLFTENLLEVVYSEGTEERSGDSSLT